MCNAAVFCKSCKKQIIFLRTNKNKYIPVNFDSLTDRDKHITSLNGDLLFRYGEHISHFATCPNANKFRRSKSNV